MDPKLQDLLDAVQNAEDGKGAEALAAFFKANPTLDVAKFTADAVAQFNEILPTAADSDDATRGVELLGEVITGLRTEQAARDEVGVARKAKLTELAAKVNGDAAPADPTDAPTEVTPEAEAPTDAPAAEVTPADAPTPVEAPAAAPASDPAPAESLAASGRPAPRRRVDLSTIPRTQAPIPTDTTNTMTITASADVPGIAMGSALTGISDLARAAVARMSALPMGPMAGGDIPMEGSPGTVVRAGIATIRNVFPQELTAKASNSHDQVEVDYAVDQKRLTGESLVASGGWCSPSETLYELAGELEAVTNLIDLPEIAVARGGIRTTEGPDFSAIYGGAGVGVVKTEAEAIAGYTKAVYRVPCTTWEDTRAGVVHTAIEAGILQNDAYPEMTERVTRGALVAHAHKINAESIRQVVDQSTPVTVPTMGPSWSTNILNGLNFLITHTRYKYRAADTMVLEVKLPLFSKELFKADLAVSTGWSRDDALNITDAQVTAWFTARNTTVQWLYDWHDAFTGITPANGGLGGATFPTAWPSTIPAVVHPAGAFIRGRGEIVSLNAVYDSTNIKVNDFLHLFVEEKLLVKRRQYISYRTTFPVDLSGVTSAPRILTSAGAVAP